MGITIREPGEGDFFSWLALYEDYATYHGRQLTDQGALVVWSWLSEPSHSERGLVAVGDDGALIGLVHFHDVPRPLDGVHALHIDDLFVLEEHREQGYGRALIESVASLGAASGIRSVEWITKPADGESRGFYDEIGDFTEVAVYRLRQAEESAADDDGSSDAQDIAETPADAVQVDGSELQAQPEAQHEDVDGQSVDAASATETTEPVPNGHSPEAPAAEEPAEDAAAEGEEQTAEHAEPADEHQES